MNNAAWEGMWKFAERHPVIFGYCVVGITKGVVGVTKALMTPFAKAPTGPVVNFDGKGITEALKTIGVAQTAQEEPTEDVEDAEYTETKIVDIQEVTEE